MFKENGQRDFGWDSVPRFGGGGGGTTTATTNSVTQPWIGQQPYLTSDAGVSGVFPEANALYRAGAPQYFPAPTYQPLLGGQQAAINQIYDTGTQGGTAPLQSAAKASTALTDPSYTAATSGAFDQANPAIGYLSSGNYLGSTAPAFQQSQGLLSNEIGGAYLNPANNPGFQNVVNTTLANVMPSITSSFTGAGRSDSGLAARAAAEGATDAIGGLTLQNYQTERGNQNTAAQQAAANQATGLNAVEGAQALASNNLLTQQGNQVKGIAVAPTIDQTTMTDLNASLQAAGLNQTDLQNQINAAVQQWNYNQMLPWNNLGLYNSMIQGSFGSGTSGTTTQPYYTNPAANAISGIGAGAVAGSALAAAFPETLGAVGLSTGGAGAIGAGLGGLIAL